MGWRSGGEPGRSKDRSPVDFNCTYCKIKLSPLIPRRFLMSLESLALLAHIIGACCIFAAFGADWIAQRGLRGATTTEALRAAMQVAASQARLGIPGLALLLLSGIYLASTGHVWQA